LPKEFSVFNIWFKDSRIGFLSGGSGTFRTVDDGNNWNKVSDAIASNLQFTSDDIGYFSCGSTGVSKSGGLGSMPSSGDIFRTTNGGETWQKMGLKVKEISCLSFISDITGFFTTIDDALYKTTDGGESCSLIEKKEMNITDMFFVNEKQGYFCTGNGISITLDGGYTLYEEYSNQGKGHIYWFDFPSPGTGYAIGNNGLIIKRN
jgi:photosystem II stability/assembly factor-like uncharacterized protein